MRRFFPYILCAAGIYAALALCGCGNSNPHNEIPEEELAVFLEKKYGDGFTLTEKEELSDGRGKDIVYTFESESGITSHISKVFSGGFMGYSYSYTDDYPVAYLREHSELIEGLLDGPYETERIDSESQHCLASAYTLYFDGYGDIVPALEFIEDFLREAEPVPDSGYTLPNAKISSRRPQVTIGNREAGNSSFGVYYFFPTASDHNTGKAEDFVQYAQDKYAGLVRDGSISATLPEHLLEKHPASAIRGITYNGRTVIDSMSYSEKYGGYCIDQYCTDRDSCEFYPDKLSGLLLLLGWDEKVSARSIVWSRGKDEVELCLKGYGLNRTELHLYKNGSEYSPRGRVLWQSGSNPIVTLSEPDLQYLFGMVFEFDQSAETGILKEG